MVPIRDEEGQIIGFDRDEGEAANDTGRPRSLFKMTWIILKWLVCAVLSIPVMTLAGVWFGVGGIFQCLNQMFKELTDWWRLR